jgi:hypothetical protein
MPNILMSLPRRGVMQETGPHMQRGVRWGTQCTAITLATRRVAESLVGTAMLLVAAGCGGDTAPTGPAAATAPLYWQLQLNHHAVTLATVAPYDTIQLTATPVDPDGVPIATTVRPVYTTNDTSITIDSTGFVRVHRTGSNALGIQVVATFQTTDARATTLADTVMINVVNWNSAAVVPRLDSLLFRPVSGDSARRALINTLGQLGTQTFDQPLVKTATGDTISNVLVRYHTSDALIASVAMPIARSTRAPEITIHAPGVVLLTAETTVYGKHVIDSVWYTVGYPLRLVCSYGIGEIVYNPELASVPANFLTLGQLTIGQGGAVLWGNSIQGTADDSLDIAFDRTTGIVGLTTTASFPGVTGAITIPPGPGGNIPAFPAATLEPFFGGLEVLTFDSVTSKARVFTQPGTYQWTSQRHQVAGTVTVVSNDSLRPK